MLVRVAMVRIVWVMMAVLVVRVLVMRMAMPVVLVFVVVSVLPVDERDSPTYRVKSKAEPFARAAKETDLVAVGLPPSKQPAPVRWADLLPRPPGPFRSR